MGYTPHFEEGTKKLYSLIDLNKAPIDVRGGDTLWEFRRMLPGTYIAAVDANDYYFFSAAALF